MPNNNDVLQWNGTGYVPSPPLAGKYYAMPPNTTGQILVYESVSDRWEIRDGANAVQLRGRDVSTSAPTEGQLLCWTTGTWTPASVGDGLDSSAGVLSVNPGNAIDVSSGLVEVVAGQGINVSADKVDAALGNGLQFDVNEFIEVAAGNGIDATSGFIEVAAGQGIDVSSGQVDVAIGNGLRFDVNNNVEIEPAAPIVNIVLAPDMPGVDGTGNNAAPVLEANQRLHDLELKLRELIYNLQLAGFMQ